MSPMPVLLLSAAALTSARLARTINGESGLTLCGTARDLSNAYMLAELHEPQIALISPDFTRQPEFEGLVTMFRVVGTVMVAIEDIGAPLADRSHGPMLRISSQASAADFQRLSEEVRQLRQARRPARPIDRPTPTTGGYAPGKMILIGASTGGIDALVTILSAFPADCPPTAIVQHTGAAYSDSLIRLFARCCPARVLAARDGITLEQGVVVIGAGCPGHLQIAGARHRQTRIAADAPVSGHRPSVDMLFRSALPHASDTIAALLTGMGRDGAEGLRDLRQAGAVTFAQDAQTSVVYGMPRAAAELNAASKILPLPRIASALLSACLAGRAEVASR